MVMLFLKLMVILWWLHLQYAFSGLDTETCILNLGKILYLKIRERVLSRFGFVSIHLYYLLLLHKTVLSTLTAIYRFPNKHHGQR